MNGKTVRVNGLAGALVMGALSAGAWAWPVIGGDVEGIWAVMVDAAGDVVAAGASTTMGPENSYRGSQGTTVRSTT